MNMRFNGMLGVMLAMVFSFPAAAEVPYAYQAETDHVQWALDATGKTVLFRDKAAGNNLLTPDAARPFCQIKKGDAIHAVSLIAVKDTVLTALFGDTAIEVRFDIAVWPHCIILSVLSINDADVDSLTLLDVPLALQGTLEEPFAACALALNLQTHVAEIPGPNKQLHAVSYKRFEIPGAAVAIAAAPSAQLRTVLKEIVSAAPGLPRHKNPDHPPIGGPWALDAPINRGSYLFDFGSLTEETVEKWIRLVKELGFNQIDFHTGSSLRFGDYAPNPKLFPRGYDSVKAVLDRLHEAGIAAGLHTYAFFIAKDSPYVTPKPDPRLGKDAAFTLAKDIDAAAAFIPVVESTANVSTATGFFARNSVTLQIEDELIVFSGVGNEPPFGFAECKRGAHGTTAAAHAAETPVYKLKECFGLFTPEGDSTLLAEVAANTAGAFNECGFDMIYLDALDGEDILAGPEYGWHYGSKFVFEIANRLERPALFEMSTFHHHLWCVRARMGAWDHPARAHKKFIDVHCAANAGGAGSYLPMNLGWWAVKTWQEGVAAVYSEPTYPDDIEYLLGKALGNDMGLSLMGVNPDNIGSTPLYQRLLPLFRRYEELRHSGVVPATIKAQLRVPGAEFMLEEKDQATPVFRPVEYFKHKVDSPDPWNTHWILNNRFEEQPVRLRIEALPAADSYEDEAAVVLEDFANPADFAARDAAEGVEAALNADTTQIKTGAASGHLTALSHRKSPLGAWAKIGKTFSPPLNISGKPALGLWVHGDHSGALLNLQLLSARHTTAGGLGDHYITVDFDGWRYFTLVEFESARIAEQGWPYGDPYNMYREHVDFGAVESFSLWCNQLPTDQPVSILVSPVKALPLSATPIVNPAITINGVTVTFPVEIAVGASLEFRAMDDCVLYGPKGEVLQQVTPQGNMPLLAAGDNAAAYACDRSGDIPSRARITVSALGTPLTP